MRSDAYHELDSQWRSVRNLSFDEGGTQLRSKGGKCIVESQGLVNVPFWGYWTSPLNGNYRWDTSWLDNDPCWIMLNSQGVLVHVNLVTNTRLIPWMVWKTWRGDFFAKKNRPFFVRKNPVCLAVKSWFACWFSLKPIHFLRTFGWWNHVIFPFKSTIWPLVKSHVFIGHRNRQSNMTIDKILRF